MQKQRIIKYIEDFGSITPLEAMRDIGCYRLSARIYDLKEEGYNIVTETVGVKNRYDEVVHVAQYSLESQE
jgi:hypothetical protein